MLKLWSSLLVAAFSKESEGSFQNFYNQFYYEKTLREASPRRQDMVNAHPPTARSELLRTKVPRDSYLGKLIVLNDHVLEVCAASEDPRGRRVCELGVQHGFSSYTILKAASYFADRVRVVSIDSEDITETGQATGHIVPADLKRIWSLQIGRVEDLLPTLGEFDFVYHDLGIASSEENIRLAYDALREGGVLFFSSRTIRPEIDAFVRDSGFEYQTTAEKVAGKHLRPVSSWAVLRKGSD
jgi:predicted O-methyltransferase YrrM